MSQRARIERALREAGIDFDEITWEPLRRGGEMSGPAGGWEIYSAEGDLIGWAYNADSLIAAINAPDGLASDHGYGVIHRHQEGEGTR